MTPWQSQPADQRVLFLMLSQCTSFSASTCSGRCHATVAASKARRQIVSKREVEYVLT